MGNCNCIRRDENLNKNCLELKDVQLTYDTITETNECKTYITEKNDLNSPSTVNYNLNCYYSNEIKSRTTPQSPYMFDTIYQDDENSEFKISKQAYYDSKTSIEVCRNSPPSNFSDVKTYEGDWLDDNRQGFGIVEFKDGTIFKGFYDNDKVNGFGINTKLKGEVFKGYWREGKALGYGIYKNLNICNYEGEWKLDKQNGFGIEVWTNGSFYVGDFLNGMKHGIGKLILKDGSIFEGEFKYNNIDGIGVLNYVGGKKEYRGEWKENKLNGHGILDYFDEKCYEGLFKDDMKHGFGIYKVGHRVYLGEWIYNNLEGEVCILNSEIGEIKNSIWKNGKKVDIINKPSKYETLAKIYVWN